MKHPTNLNRDTPLVFHSCISYLLENGVTTEGIFRIPGNQQEIDEMKHKWNTGYPIANYKNYDVPDIAGLLKAFVRQLPDVLFSRELIHEWEKLAGPKILKDSDIINFKIELSNLLQKLPRVNQFILKELFHLLYVISQHKETKMNAENLATCWTPNLFTIDVINLAGASPGFRVIVMMIDHSEDVFLELK